MGDSGALLLGFMLGGGLGAGPAEDGRRRSSLVLPLLVLAVPILDTSFVVARRLKHGQPIYVARPAHLHHRFLRRGFSQRRAVADHVGLVRDARRRRARDALHPVPQGGEWHLWRDARGCARSRSSRSPFSVYIVYVLEIVKSTNPSALPARAPPRRAAKSASSA